MKLAIIGSRGLVINDLENYLPGDPASGDYVSEICIPVRKRRSDG